MDTPRPTDPQMPDESHWLELEPPAVSSDFVERTLERVARDQQEIAAEAERVDEIRLPADVLAAYAPPDPSPDFVERVTRAVGRQRHGPDLAEVMRVYQVPAPSPEFVERTLRALREERAHPDGQVAPQRPWLAVALAAAALVMAAFLLWPREPGHENLSEAMAATWSEESARSYSPAPVAAVLHDVMWRDDPGDVAMPAVDGLALLLRAREVEASRR